MIKNNTLYKATTKDESENYDESFYINYIININKNNVSYLSIEIGTANTRCYNFQNIENEELLDFKDYILDNYELEEIDFSSIRKYFQSIIKECFYTI